MYISIRVGKRSRIGGGLGFWLFIGPMIAAFYFGVLILYATIIAGMWLIKGSIWAAAAIWHSNILGHTANAVTPRRYVPIDPNARPVDLGALGRGTDPWDSAPTRRRS